MMLKNTLKKIKKSIGRYLSLLVIILIGVAFYSGIKASVPNIREIQKDYYYDTNLMDIKIVSTHGLTESDVEYLQKIDGINEVTGSYSKYVFDDEEVIQVHSIEKNINTFNFVDGRLPKNSYECLADYKNYKVGDTITLAETSNEDLKIKKFKVVGTIMSPLYTSNDYGSATIGNGKLKSYVFLPKEVFNYDVYTEVYITINKDNKDTPYSDSYEEKLEKVITTLEQIKTDREQLRLNELMNMYLLNINTNNVHIPEVTWHIQDREQVINSYKVLSNQYEEVEIIADIIPIFFILVVALMTSNTMARMITEERSEMGTFSSLGISNIKIIGNYLIYVLSSTILGVILGFIIGTVFLPQLVYDCFPVSMPQMKYNFDVTMFILVLITSSIVMSLVTIFSCLKELKQMPAYLLRPVAPKQGKVILLEKINCLWNRLSFSWKITLRNISRYKKRVIMTLVGTAGCTFLILIGFAIRDSVNGIGGKQYTELFKYDNLIILQKEINKGDKSLNNELETLVEDEILLKQSAYKVVNKEKRFLDTYLVIPEEENTYFEEYFVLRDYNTHKSLYLNDEGVIITPRIKDVFDVEVGEEITLEDLEQNKVQVKVIGITENYVSNYIYMTENLYRKTFNKEVTYNTIVSKNILEENKLAKELLQIDEIINVNFSSDLLEKANNGISGLNNIVVLLVAISSLLAFTVLYNLTSINISERTREIATLKVLGFKDSETNEYIYRETIITVILGIIIGILITPILHHYIINLLEADNMIFLREIKKESYIYASLLTFSFAIIMQIVTYFKLKKVNMIESLKSVE